MSESHSRNVLESLNTIAGGLNCVSQVLPYHQAVPHPALCSSPLIQHVRDSQSGAPGFYWDVWPAAAATVAQALSSLYLTQLLPSQDLLRSHFLLVSIRAREDSEESGGYYVRRPLYLKLLHRL